MSKVYFAIFLIVAFYLIYKVKTKKPKQNTNAQRNNGNKEGNFSDLATMFLFSELLHENGQSTRNLYGSNEVNYPRQFARTQIVPPRKTTRYNNCKATCTDKKGQNKYKPKRKRWGNRARNMIASGQGWKCAICHKSLPASWELDHKIPLVAGGLDEISQCQALCNTCHREKTNLEGIKYGF